MEGSAHNSEGETALRGTETKEPERDVYTFPGDSDPESPPPAPWAHCTFIQRCRKKRVLLRPFSGLGTAKHPSPESPGTLTRPNPPKSKNLDAAPLSPGGGLYDFEEVSFEEGTAESVKFRDRGGKSDKEEAEEEGGADPGKEIFTCVECSIYFKKQIHLQEHMMEHCEGGPGAGRRFGKGSRFRCVECGWTLPNRLSLAEHHRRHQESRQKILAEIQKLNQNESASLTRDCNFSTRTSQALANHSKTHNRKRPPLHADAPPPGSPSGVASTSLACAHCAFLTSSQAILREHQLLVHPEEGPAGGMPDEGKGPPIRSNMVDEDEREAPKDGKVFFLRRSARVTAAPAESDSEDDDGDIDEERVRRFLSEGILDEDNDEIDEDTEALRSVERKCPYCPDRFHNGIGLANHVRGHLNRVGVSYNVRHFISPEEVKAIEKKFSYQKKKKKVANFDPDTFSVMHCEFCSAGFDTRAGLSSHARAHLRDFGITNWDVTISPIHILRELWTPSRPASTCPTGSSRLLSAVRYLKCEVCGARFETRRGLSSHARSHLRQLGITVSESSGAPIDLLYQIAKDSGADGEAGRRLLEPPPLDDMDLDQKPIPLPVLARVAPPSSSSTPTPSPGASPAPAHSGSPSSVVKKAPISSLLPVSSPLRSSEHKAAVLKSLNCGLSAPPTIAKPLWAPQENDAPLNLSEPPKEIGCEFCGEYFENRKGLSSHARSHLRQMGITEWSVNGSPIDTLREIITRRGLPCALPLKPLKTPPPSSPGPPRSPSGSSGGLLLKIKPEPVQLEVTPAALAKTLHPGQNGAAVTLSSAALSNYLAFFSPGSSSAMAHEVEPTRDIRCEFCGEYFENRKGLSSHARSHLRQMGITEWSVNGSPIDTLREKESGQGAGSPQWDAASEGLAVSGFQSTKFRKSPLSLLQSGPRLHKQGVGSAGASATLPAGKFFRIGSDPTPPGRGPQLRLDSPSPPSPLSSDPSCELCGFYFENRKALASHARAHLRQFGVTEWCVNGSPIETLSAWMRSRPQKVLEMHRSYMQGNRSAQKKVRTRDPDPVGVLSGREPGAAAGPRPGPGGLLQDAGGRPRRRRLAGGGLQGGTQQPRPVAARRRASAAGAGAERDSGPPKPPRTGTVPALVPKPPSYPLVKLVGKFYTLKCRFCEVEFHGPLSVQEDWIRHLQQHILKMNYSKPARSPPKEPSEPQAPSKQLSRLLLRPVATGTKRHRGMGHNGNCPRS
uniref:Si:ch211-194b1.1 n=1 Tax=Salarias fasciatus TaxID=181472 RepID=A0A672FZV4_SALFA